jgi:3-dehydroquinate synthase
MGPLKNVLGTFSEPEITIVDPDFLRTLPKRELYCGLAEMAKHALVADVRYWKKIKAKSYRKIEHFLDLVGPSVEIKKAIVKADPFENAERKMLNFGHTVGHAVEGFALEAAMDVKHGEAIAVGIVCESHISWKRGSISKAELEEITAFFRKHFRYLKMATEQHERVIELMRHDKKNKGGTIRMSLLKGIGKCKTDVEVNAVEIMRALKYYQWLE